MKNVINYYYNINADNIHQNNRNYRFRIDNIDYFFVLYNENIDNIKKIYDIHLLILQMGLYCHEIVLNIDNSPLTLVDGKYYILLRVKIQNRKVELEDVLYFSQYYIIPSNNSTYYNGNFNKKKVRSAAPYDMLYINDWFNLWTQKTDYIEYQVSQVGIKYPLINSSASYYIGLSENAISYLKNNPTTNIHYSISHKRIKSNSTLFDLYNPVNFIIDSSVRDICEYIKDSFFEGKNQIISCIQNLVLSKDDAIFFISRMLYPTYYFDAIEDCIDNKENDTKILKYVDKVDSFQLALKDVMIYLRNRYSVPVIEWIIKT
ncbi:MAG: hypothetical protein NC181_00275 [Clostridium sp.]|nr:hypothetical protein [Clostridium sp.]MCM1443888.1 hypothetical protein [Candidatus Amulumruptor caecigallinarius]